MKSTGCATANCNPTARGSPGLAMVYKYSINPREGAMTKQELIREKEELTVGLEQCAQRFESQCEVKESLSDAQKEEALLRMQKYLDRTFAWE